MRFFALGLGNSFHRVAELPSSGRDRRQGLGDRARCSADAATCMVDQARAAEHQSRGRHLGVFGTGAHGWNRLSARDSRRRRRVDGIPGRSRGKLPFWLRSPVRGDRRVYDGASREVGKVVSLGKGGGPFTTGQPPGRRKPLWRNQDPFVTFVDSGSPCSPPLTRRGGTEVRVSFTERVARASCSQGAAGSGVRTNQGGRV